MLGIVAFSHQALAFRNPFRLVDLKKPYGGTTFGCFPKYVSAAQLKIATPILGTRMVKETKGFGRRIK